jgi:hypothetical protein
MAGDSRLVGARCRGAVVALLMFRLITFIVPKFRASVA